MRRVLLALRMLHPAQAVEVARPIQIAWPVWPIRRVRLVQPAQVMRKMASLALQTLRKHSSV